MGCPTRVRIGDNLVFGIATHDPDTGILTDADAVPNYRIYEDENATPVKTGALAKLDDANTTGFYTELISCISVNGFKASRTYTIYITATVGGDTGGMCYAFRPKKMVPVKIQGVELISRKYVIIKGRIQIW